MKNFSKWILALAIPVAFSAAAVQKNGATLTKYNLPAGWISTISNNGKWAIWNYPSNDEPDANLSVIDVEKGEIVDMKVKPISLADGAKAVPNVITNDGRFVFGSYISQPGYFDRETGLWENLSLPKNMRKWSGYVSHCTPDGKTLLGFISPGDFTDFTGIIWTWDDDEEDWVVHTDLNFPTHEDLYNAGLCSKEDYDEYMGQGKVNANIMFMKLSSDGKLAVAGINHNQNWANSVCLYHIDTNSWEFITAEDQAGNLEYAYSATMSNNGKWVYAASIPFQTHEDIEYGFMLNTETGEITYPKVLGSIDLIDNDGNFYYSVGRTDGSPISSLCVGNNNQLVDVHMILKQVYDIDFLQETGWPQTGFVAGISDDGKVLACNASPREAGYIMSFPEQPIEAAKKVNVLSNWLVAPVAGTPISEFEAVVLSLSNPADVDTSKKAVIKDEAGNIVAGSVEITPSNGVKSIYRVAFRKQIFEEGKKYTVEVPEGLFYVKDSNHRNPLIQVEYVGRKGGPVQRTAVSPDQNTSLQEIGMTNSVRVAFDAEIRTATNVYGALYEKGGSLPISDIVGSAEGRYLYLYTPASRKLNLGVTYEIRIPEGMVTDVVGFCPNEAFTLTYDGAYVPDITNRFEANFNDPNEALSQFLQYEGDHNTPNAAMEQIGFDNDNTPWNFSIRDDGEWDYCAGSHSMYDPAGKSDDWLVIPQMTVDNKDIWLSFKAQSYRNSKKDVLKVLVWPCEETYGSLDKSIVDRMRKEGKVVFEEQVFPGSSEPKLAGDWQTKELQLDEFVGKKVYIAFVNENENQSMIFLDDIEVKYLGNYIAGTTTESVVVQKDDVKINAFVTNESPNTVKKITASYKNENTGSTDTYTADVNLAMGETHLFSFAKPMTLEKGVENKYTIDFQVDDEKQSITQTVKNLKYDFAKKVLVEEITGLWCGNCPQGVLAFEYLENQFPGQIIPVAVHNNDIYAYTGYESFLQLAGYPTGKVNRGNHVLAPMMSNGLFYSPSENETWYDFVAKELAVPTDTKLTIKSADYCLESKQIEVQVDVEFAMDKKNMNYNVFTVVLEDELPGFQTNYFYNSTDPVYGEWGQGGAYGEHDVLVMTNHVARGIAGNSFYGEGKKIPANAKVDEVYSSWVHFDRPANLMHTNAETNINDKMSIACVVIDATTGYAITGDIVHNVGVKEISGVKEIAGAEADAELRLTVADGKVLANGSTDGVEVYTLDGTRIANSGLNGFYIVRAADENGTVKASKIVVK